MATKEVQEYIANCLFRIMTAPCLPANVYRRALDISQAITDWNTYATQRPDENTIHVRLVALVDLAEQGYYNQPLPIKGESA